MGSYQIDMVGAWFLVWRCWVSCWVLFGLKQCVCPFQSNLIIRGLTDPVFWSNVFPVRLTWISTIFYLIGGGELVMSAMIFTMVADIAPEEKRCVPQPRRSYRIETYKEN